MAEDSDKAQTEKPEKEGSVPPAAPEVKFRARKRARKARSKRDVSSNKGADSSDDDNGISRAELMLMREAQILREQSRKTSLDVSLGRDDKIVDAEKGDSAGADDIASGLQNNFAVEKSGHAVEQRMEKYIEERMRIKFGRKDDDTGLGQPRPGYDESELFAIPERLQVVERPMYDPGEGLPAGVEEVEVSEDVRRRNEEETVKAHQQLIAAKEHRDEVDVDTLPGNLSANFVQHRNEWMDAHLGPKDQRANVGGRGAQTGGSRHGAPRGDGKTEQGVNRRNFQMASDLVIAERFKRRWRR